MGLAFERGTLVVTNRQVVFKSYERTVHFAYGELRDVQYDGHIRLLIGRRQTPIILSTARGNFVTMLIRILTESTFRDGRLPEGLVVSARPNANGRGVDLSFDTVGQHPIGPRMQETPMSDIAADGLSGRAPMGDSGNDIARGS